MKKYLSLLFCFLLLFGLWSSPVSAMEMMGATVTYSTTGDSFDPEVFAKVGDAIYALNGGIPLALLRYNPADGSHAVEYNHTGKEPLRFLYAQDGALMVLDEAGELFRYDPAEKKLSSVKKFNLSLKSTALDRFFFQNKVPVLLLSNYEENTSKLIWLDDSGKELSLPAEAFYMAMTPYKDGAILAMNYEGFHLIKDGAPSKFETAEENAEFNIDTLFFDEETQTLYATEGNYVYQLDDKLAKTLAGYIPFSASSYMPYVYANKTLLYTVSANSGMDKMLAVLDTTQMHLPEALIKVNGLSGDLANLYNRKNPDLPIATTGMSFSAFTGDASSLANHMKSSDAADVYFFSRSSIRNDLARHGYAEPLDSSAALMGMHDRMYPYLQKQSLYEGKLYFMPYSLSRDSVRFEYDPKVLEGLGFDEADLPKTYDAFVNFVKEAESRIEGTEYSLSEMHQYFSAKMYAANNILVEHFASQLRAGQPIKFNTPEMISLLQNILKVQFETLPNSMNDLAGGSFSTEADKENLLGMNYAYAATALGNKPLPLRIHEGDEPITVASVGNAMVNSLSTNKALSIEFLERFFQILDETTQTYLYSDKNEPVKDPNQIKFIAYLEKQIEEQKKSLAELSENEKKAVQQNIEMMEKDLEETRKRSYSITAEDLSYYKEHIGEYYVLDAELIDFKSEQQTTLIERFFNNQIDPASFLNELDRIVNMSLLESK